MKLSDWDEDRENTKRERDWLVGTLASVERAMAIRQAQVDITVDGQSVIRMRPMSLLRFRPQDT